MYDFVSQHFERVENLVHKKDVVEKFRKNTTKMTSKGCLGVILVGSKNIDWQEKKI